MKIAIVSNSQNFLNGGSSCSDNLSYALKQRFSRLKIYNFSLGKDTFEKILKNHPDIVHMHLSFLRKQESTNIDSVPDCFASIRNDKMEIISLAYCLNTAKIPVVLSFYSLYSQLTYSEALYYNIVSYLVDAVIVLEKFQLETLKKYLDRGSNIFVIPYGFGPKDAEVDKNVIKKAYGWEDKLVVGMYGDDSRGNGFVRIAKLWPEIKRRVPNAHLVNESHLRSERSPTLRKWDSSSIYKILAGFDVAVFPYKSELPSENLALAYAVGLPVVVSSSKGLVSSVKQSRAGYIAHIDEDYVAYIVALLKNENRRKNFSRNSLNYCKKISNWQKTAERHMKVFRTAIHNNQVRRHKKKYLMKRNHV